MAVLHRTGAAPWLVAGAALGAAVVLRVHDPHVPGSYGACPFLGMTGLPCPGCGGLRAVNDLTRGDLVAAAGSNAYAVLTLAAVVLWWLAWVVRLGRGAGRSPSGTGLADGGGLPGGPGHGAAAADRRVVWLAAVWVTGFLVFGVLRWLPAFAVLRP